MSRLGGGGMDKKHFIEMFIVKMYFHFKTLSMLIMCAESLSYDVEKLANLIITVQTKLIIRTPRGLFGKLSCLYNQNSS